MPTAQTLITPNVTRLDITHLLAQSRTFLVFTPKQTRLVTFNASFPTHKRTLAVFALILALKFAYTRFIASILARMPTYQVPSTYLLTRLVQSVAQAFAARAFTRMSTV